MTKLCLYVLLAGLILSILIPGYQILRSANGIQEIIENAGERASELQWTMISEMVSTAITHISNSRSATDESEAKFEARMANHILSGLINGLDVGYNISAAEASGESSHRVLIEVIPQLEDTKSAIVNAKYEEAIEALRNVNSTFSNSFN